MTTVMDWAWTTVAVLWLPPHCETIETLELLGPDEPWLWPWAKALAEVSEAASIATTKMLPFMTILPVLAQ